MYKIGSGKGLVIFVHFVALSKKFQCLKDPEDKDSDLGPGNGNMKYTVSEEKII